MASYAIPVSWYNFVDYYPLFTKTNVATKAGNKVVVKLKDPRGSLNGELDGWVSELFNENVNYTTCCIQMSHALNMAFVNSDVSKMVGAHSVRRNSHSATVARAGNREFQYLAAVDEMKAFLDDTFEPGRKITSRKDIEDQPGIVVFMGTSPWGVHTEIWLGDDFTKHS
jgi:Type VI secretion system (T6SS), amidase effector protein 4